MSQENDYDIRDQHNILVLEMLTNPYVDMVTKNLLRSVIWTDNMEIRTGRSKQDCTREASDRH